MHTHTRTHTHACAHRDIRDIHNVMHACMHAHHTHTRALVVGGDRTTHSEHWHCSVRTMAGFVPLNPACDPMMSFGCRTVSENHSRREGEATQMQTKWLLKLGGRASIGAHASPHVLGIPYHPCGYQNKIFRCHAPTFIQCLCFSRFAFFTPAALEFRTRPPLMRDHSG